MTLEFILYSLSFQVENLILHVSAKDLDRTHDPETEEMELKEKPREGETSKQAGLETQNSIVKESVAPSHQLTGRVGLQASFVPPIIPLFKQVNET